MSVLIQLWCNGCSASTRAGHVERRFEGIHGGDSGFGYWRTELPDAPDGWTMFDPYTQCTYCPVCSEELFGPPVNQDAADEVPADFDHYAVLA